MTRWRIATVAGVAVGLVLIGAGVGHLVWPAQETVLEVVNVVPNAAGDDAGLERSFPNILGLEESTALTVLEDAGYGGLEISRTAEAAAGPAGFVLRQTPEPGTAKEDVQSIDVVLTSSVEMPDLVNQTRAEAQAVVEELGGLVVVKPVVSAEAEAGTVIGTVPDAGASMTLEVELLVADGGQSVALVDLAPVAGERCSEARSSSVNGTVLGPSPVCQPRSDGQENRLAFVEYALGRKAAFLELSFGLQDDADTGAAELRVIGDGAILATESVSFGEIEQLRINVGGILRLRMEVTSTVTESEPRVVLGEARINGAPADISTLVDR